MGGEYLVWEEKGNFRGFRGIDLAKVIHQPWQPTFNPLPNKTLASPMELLVVN